MPDTLSADSIVWTSGSNVTGYLPESDVQAFATADQARANTADEIDRLADYLCEGEQITAADDYATEEEFNTADDRPSISASALAGLVKTDPDQDYRGEFTVYVDTGRSLDTAYWVHQSTVGEVFGEEWADSDEFAEFCEYCGL
jgi:hypothetical protein